MIVPEATVNYVAAISGVTVSERKEYHLYIIDEISKRLILVAANIGTNAAEAPAAVSPAPTASDPVTPLPGTYGGPGYPPVEFPGAYLEIPLGVSPTDTTVRWYTVTVGLRVGVFPHWYVFPSPHVMSCN